MRALLLLFITPGDSPLPALLRPLWRPSLMLLLAGLLQACVSSAPPAEDNPVWAIQRDRLQAMENWQLRGRVNVRYDNESNTPRIQWEQHGEEYRIRLWGTFNAGNTLIDGRPGTVRLRQGDDVLTAESPEDLILEQLGYELPVSYLEYWIRGLPAPASRAQLNFDEFNNLASLRQDGWTVLYPDPRQYGELSLPREVEVTRPRNDVELRFIGLNWTLDELED